MLQPGVYCFLITMQFTVTSYPNGWQLATRSGTYTAKEGETRLDAIAALIKELSGSIRAEDPKDLADNGAVIFLYFEPN